MKDCCLEIWFETNLAIRMITWEHIRSEYGYDPPLSQDRLFPITYYCPTCKRRFGKTLKDV